MHPPAHAVTRDTVADDKPERAGPRPRIRRMRVNFTRSGPSAEPTAVEDVNYRPTSTERPGRCFAVPTSRFGDACLFRIDDSFEHMVSAGRGEAPRCCYAGWFTGKWDYREVLREAASPA